MIKTAKQKLFDYIYNEHWNTEQQLKQLEAREKEILDYYESTGVYSWADGFDYDLLAKEHEQELSEIEQEKELLFTYIDELCQVIHKIGEELDRLKEV